jgi:hypothetical protein
MSSVFFPPTAEIPLAILCTQIRERILLRVPMSSFESNVWRILRCSVCFLVLSCGFEVLFYLPDVCA